MPAKTVNWREAQRKAAMTGRWAVTMTKVRIRKITARTRWQLVTFCGSAGGESKGIVDLLAVRKDHGKPADGLNRGDGLQIVLIQVKGGAAAMPTVEDWRRLRVVAKRYHAKEAVLAAWTKGAAARFFRPRVKAVNGKLRWVELADLRTIFH
jgi:hypothetical protein